MIPSGIHNTTNQRRGDIASTCRGFVASTGLDAHKSVLDNVDSAHTIGPRNFVQVNESFQRISERGAGGLVDDLTRISYRERVV